MSDKLYVVTPDGEEHELGESLTLAVEPEDEPALWATPYEMSLIFELTREATERAAKAFDDMRRCAKRACRRIRKSFRYIGNPNENIKYCRRQDKALARSRRNTHYKRFKHGRTYRTKG